jgi:hypothetical protein
MIQTPRYIIQNLMASQNPLPERISVVSELAEGPSNMKNVSISVKSKPVRENLI